jgi:hypothetical protein
MPWAFKLFGTLADPVHKSALNELTGEYGCQRRYRYQRDAEADGTERESRGTVNPHLACGTAMHETIARALNNPRVRDHLLRVDGAELAELSTKQQLESRVRATFSHELRVAADGRDIDWGREDAESMISERVDMCVGVLGSLCKYVRRVVAVEPGFIFELEGIWYSGHIDLVFEPADAPGTLGVADWKSSKQKPHPLELAHGWEQGLYAAALTRGVMLPRESVALDKRDDGTWSGVVTFIDPADVDVDFGGEYSEVIRPTRWQAERDGLETALKRLASGDVQHADAFTPGAYPTRVYHVHARDFVPYEKSGGKEAKRVEDLAHYGLTAPARVKYVAGEMRGPGWLPAEVHEHDVSRLALRARGVVGTVRMGRFFDAVREHCERCPFKRECLTSGYSPRGDELAALQSELKKAGIPL